MIFRIFLLASFSFLSVTLNAQDIIHLLNGQKIKAQVIEVGLDDIIYHSPAGVETKIVKSEVQKIHYKNGNQEEFNPARPIESREVTEKPMQPDTKPAVQKTMDKKVIEKPIGKKDDKAEEPSKFKKRLFLGINLGSSSPIGDYGDNSASNRKAGYALTGIDFSVDFGYELHKNFGLALNLFAAAHSIDNETYAQNYVASLAGNPNYTGYTTTATADISPSSLSGVLFGGYVQIPVRKFSLLFKLMGGITSGSTGSILIDETSTNKSNGSYGTASSSVNSLSSSGFGYNTGIGVRYNFNSKFFVCSNLDILGYNANFSQGPINYKYYNGTTAVGSTIPYSADMNVFNFTVGAGIKFGKK